MPKFKLFGIALTLVGLALHAQVPTRPAPSDDDLRREERDAQYMMQLQVKNAEDQARTQEKLRSEQERAASAMRQLYDGILEKQRQESGAFTDDERAMLAARQQQQGGAMVSPQAALAVPANGYIPPALPAPGRSPAIPGTEATKAVEALAMEDGPEIARAKGLGFVPLGTIADVRLLTAVNTAIPGVVIGQVIYDIWDVDARMIVIPRGSKLIGQAGAMSSDTEARGKVVFNSFVDPGGRVIPIATPVIAANRVGVTGIDGQVDYHWARMLGSSLTLAVISGFTGGNSASPGSANANNGDLVRQNAVSSMGQTSNQLLNRFTRVMPDITLEEGSVAKIILTTSIMAKPYRIVYK